MCKYCEPLPNVNFCVSIADTGFDNCAIMYDMDVPFIGLSCDEFVSSEPINYCPFCGRNLRVEIIFDDDDEDDVPQGPSGASPLGFFGAGRGPLS